MSDINSQPLCEQPDPKKHSIEDGEAGTDAKKIKLCVKMPICNEVEDLQKACRNTEEFEQIDQLKKLPESHPLRQKMEQVGLFQGAELMKNMMSSFVFDPADDGKVSMQLDLNVLKSMIEFGAQMNQKMGIGSQENIDEAKKIVQSIEKFAANVTTETTTTIEDIIKQSDIDDAKKLVQSIENTETTTLENVDKQTENPPANPFVAGQSQMFQSLNALPTSRIMVQRDHPLVQAHVLSADDIFNEGLYALCWHRIFLESLLKRVGPNLIVIYDNETGCLARCSDLLRRISKHKKLSLFFYDNTDLVTTDPVVAQNYVKSAPADKLPFFVEVVNQYAVDDGDGTLHKKVSEYEERISKLKKTA